MRRLAAQLGVRLLNRTTRSVIPTEAGERLLERLGIVPPFLAAYPDIRLELVAEEASSTCSRPGAMPASAAASRAGR